MPIIGQKNYDSYEVMLNLHGTILSIPRDTLLLSQVFIKIKNGRKNFINLYQIAFQERHQHKSKLGNSVNEPIKTCYDIKLWISRQRETILQSLTILNHFLANKSRNKSTIEIKYEAVHFDTNFIVKAMLEFNTTVPKRTQRDDVETKEEEKE